MRWEAHRFELVNHTNSFPTFCENRGGFILEGKVARSRNGLENRLSFTGFSSSGVPSAMKIIYNSIIPFPGFLAINLFGILFVRKGGKVSDIVLNHEEIHTAQMKELGYIGFYLIYIIEWLVRLFMSGNAYRNISFEKEAYANERNLEYLDSRKHYAMWRSIR